MAIKKSKNEKTTTVLDKVKPAAITGVSCIDYDKFVKSLTNLEKVRIIDFDNYQFYTSTIMQEVNFYCKSYKVKNKKFKELFEQKLNDFGFDESILKRKIITLSTNEKKKFYLLLNLSFDFDSVILRNIFKCVDKRNYNIYLKEIKNLKEQKKKILLIDDINILYTINDQMLILKGNKIIKLGDSKEILNDVKYLIDNNIEPPYLSKLTYLAKEKKGIKLFYQNDVRDVIKDVYKHV